MKNFLLILSLGFLLVFSLTSCTDKNETIMTVDGIEIRKGIYTYYYEEAKKETDKDKKREEIALSACKDYAATQLLLKEKNLSVRPYFKRKTAEDTESIWGMFGEYYKTVGVTKQDINAVTFHKYSKKELLHYYYGSDGLKPVSTSELKEEFVDLYVGFKAIEGSLTKENSMGETVALSEDEISAIESKFRTMASDISNRYATIDELNEKYNDSLGLIVTDTLPVILIKKGDGNYDEEFFDKVMDIPHGYARVVQTDTAIYVVQRASIATSDEDAFTQYSSEVLEEMKMGSIDELIRKRADKCKVEY